MSISIEDLQEGDSDVITNFNQLKDRFVKLMIFLELLYTFYLEHGLLVAAQEMLLIKKDLLELGDLLEYFKALYVQHLLEKTNTDGAEMKPLQDESDDDAEPNAPLGE